MNSFNRQMFKWLQQRQCPDCGGKEVISDHTTGELTCCHCGLVISEIALISTPEWRAFTPEEQAGKVRTGAPIKLHHFDQGIFTTFQTQKDRFSQSLPYAVQQKM